MKNVLFLHAFVKQYRLPFFEKVSLSLKEEKIQFIVAYGQPSRVEAEKSDVIEIDEKIGVRVKNYWLFGDKLLLQVAFRQIIEADLIIVELANKHIINYLLIALSVFKLKKLAFWGHGRNRQSRKNTISEWWKQKILNKANWWFAYTKGTADYLITNGVSKERITVIQNSIDTELFKANLESISESDLLKIKHQLLVSPSAQVGIFCGSLYADKCLSFLINAAKLIKAKIPNFELIIIGDGSDSDFIRNTVSNVSWIHYLGAKFGMEKALYFAIADVFLMPGLVGLAILDAFTAGLPLVTTDIPIHSPEIEYLDDGFNGVITSHNLTSYSDAVVHLLADKTKLRKLSDGAKMSAETYSINAMVENFKAGVVQCLESSL